jgi:hypothetical protein
MAPTVERQVKIILELEDIQRIVVEYINENKGRFNVQESFRAEDVRIEWGQDTLEEEHMNKIKITALSKTKEKL